MPMIRRPHHIAIGMPSRMPDDGHGEHKADVPGHEAKHDKTHDDQAPDDGQWDVNCERDNADDHRGDGVGISV